METSNPYVSRVDGLSITPEGRDLLGTIVTDTTGQVYAFTRNADPLITAAAMARLSRRGDDLRLIYLDEFADTVTDAAEVLRRVLTAFGDDSVQQLIYIPFVTEGISNLMTKMLEWGRLGNYLEQSTRYIFFDRKDADGRYSFYTPPNLKGDVRRVYEEKTAEIFECYSELVRGMAEFIRKKHPHDPEKDTRATWMGATRAQACDAARNVLPVSTKSTVGVVASAQAIEALVMRLSSEDLYEAQDLATSVLRECRKVAEVFFERADMPDRGGATSAYLAATRAGMVEVAKKHLDLFSPSIYQSEPQQVRLVNYGPFDELELVVDMLAEARGVRLDRRNIEQQVARLSQAAKAEIFHAYMGERLNRRHRPGRAIEHAFYQWELITDYGIFRDLQRHRMVSHLYWQRLSIEHGYLIPPLVWEAGFRELFLKCFTIAEDLFRILVQNGYEEEAQYATLLGHQMRWGFTENAREAFHIHELRTHPTGHPGYRMVVNLMHQQVAQVHPRIAEAMCFVNQSEDPALTRLASERATARKLSLLEKGRG